ncbi:MAG: hypothetical protein OXE44_18220 [Nitrospinae bacterium]|nr:hypothetical protein [Nitrospinota bacterium]
MNGNDEAGRISRLCAALARITGTLDPPAGLREVVDGARALTDTRYAAITTEDESGVPQEFVTSGVSREEKLRLTSCRPVGPAQPPRKRMTIQGRAADERRKRQRRLSRLEAAS